MQEPSTPPTLVRHESEVPSEPSTCGYRYLLMSRADADRGVAAWVHAADIDGAKEHYHAVGTELYYVLEGEGAVRLDGVEHPVRKGSLVHIPPGVLHGAVGRMRILVVGIPDMRSGRCVLPRTKTVAPAVPALPCPPLPYSAPLPSAFCPLPSALPATHGHPKRAPE